MQRTPSCTAAIVPSPARRQSSGNDGADRGTTSSQGDTTTRSIRPLQRLQAQYFLRLPHRSHADKRDRSPDDVPRHTRRCSDSRSSHATSLDLALFPCSLSSHNDSNSSAYPLPYNGSSHGLPRHGKVAQNGARTEIAVPASTAAAELDALYKLLASQEQQAAEREERLTRLLTQHDAERTTLQGTVTELQKSFSKVAQDIAGVTSKQLGFAEEMRTVSESCRSIQRATEQCTQLLARLETQMQALDARVTRTSTLSTTIPAPSLTTLTPPETGAVRAALSAASPPAQTSTDATSRSSGTAFASAMTLGRTTTDGNVATGNPFAPAVPRAPASSVAQPTAGGAEHDSHHADSATDPDTTTASLPPVVTSTTEHDTTSAAPTTTASGTTTTHATSAAPPAPVFSFGSAASVVVPAATSPFGFGARTGPTDAAPTSTTTTAAGTNVINGTSTTTAPPSHPTSATPVTMTTNTATTTTQTNPFANATAGGGVSTGTGGGVWGGVGSSTASTTTRGVSGNPFAAALDGTASSFAAPSGGSAGTTTSWGVGARTPFRTDSANTSAAPAVSGTPFTSAVFGSSVAPAPSSGNDAATAVTPGAVFGAAVTTGGASSPFAQSTAVFGQSGVMGQPTSAGFAAMGGAASGDNTSILGTRRKRVSHRY